jgi:hypothetical protein
MALAALLVAAEGAYLHTGILEFSYSPELPKHVSVLFTFDAIRRDGMGRLADFNREGEWCAVADAMSYTLPIERKAQEMVDAILEGLHKIFG